MRLLVVLALLLPAAAWADGPWDRYQLLMWQDRTPAQLRGLRAMGFTGAKLRATGGVVDAEGLAARAAAGLEVYYENLATDFYSPYHRYTEGKAVTWLFEAAKARLRAGDPRAFDREPSLSDPDALRAVVARVERTVRGAPGRPLFYNLADEAGIGDLAAAWDGDTSAASLAAFRAWLATQYPDVEALNREWGSAFPGFDAVVPELTDAALRRRDANYAAWSDFKAFMDVAFARAVRAGADAVHGADPAALAGLEGGQVPGWGGYDYALLAPAVDVMEVYDFGESFDLAMAFHPGLLALRTSFARGPREAHAIWRSVLHGGRGLVVWDEADDVVAADGSPGPRGRELSALVAEVGGAAPLLRRPHVSDVAVLVSQASFRVGWLLDRRAGDRAWAARDAEREYDDNAWRASRRVLVERLAALGVGPRFVSGAMLEGGVLRDGVRVLLLPHAIALSDAEVAAIQAFRAAGGTVLADGEPGLFDGHGRRRALPPLSDVPHPVAVRPDGEAMAPAVLEGLATLLGGAGAPPAVTILGPDGARATGIEARWFDGEGGPLLSLQAARPWSAPPRVTVRFGAPMQVTDVRHPGPPLVAASIDVVLDAIAPTLLQLRPASGG